MHTKICVGSYQLACGNLSFWSVFHRRYVALCISKNIFALDEEIDEIVGHSYLFLKEQLEISAMPLPSGILHGTIIG